MEQAQQELMMKFQMFEQQINQINQQLQAVEQAMMELANIHAGLNDLIGAKGKEMMAPIGRGIFVKSKLLDEELTVDIGEKTFVKKSIPETQKILKDQISKLQEAQEQLNCNLEEINQELTKTFMESQRNQQSGCGCHDSKEDCKKDCGDDCGCEEKPKKK